MPKTFIHSFFTPENPSFLVIFSGNVDCSTGSIFNWFPVCETQRDRGINLDSTPPSLLKSQLHYGWIEKRVHKEVNNHIMFFTQGRQGWSFITVPKRLNQYGSLHRKRSLPRQALFSIFSSPFTFPLYDSIWFNFTVKKEKKKKTNDLIKGRLDKILHIDTFKKQEALYQGEPFSLSQRRCNK